MMILGAFSVWLVPAILFFVPLFAYYKKVAIYDEFIKGAEEGLRLTWKLLPFLIAMLGAIAVFTQGGAMTVLFSLFSPFTNILGIPEAVLPLAVMRPFSGSGSLGMTASILNEFGADSFTGRLASIIQGSTETTFYVLTVYFGSVGIVKYRHALWVGLIGDAVAFIAGFYITCALFT
ncbi:MAG: spore maturation protein [Clostridiales bacterium]